MCTVSSLSLRWDWLYLILRTSIRLNISRSQYLPLDSRSLFSLALCRDVQLDVLLLEARRVLRHGSSPSVRASQLIYACMGAYQYFPLCVHGGIPIFFISSRTGLYELHCNLAEHHELLSYTFTALVTSNHVLGTMPRPGLNPARRGHPVKVIEWKFARVIQARPQRNNL